VDYTFRTDIDDVPPRV